MRKSTGSLNFIGALSMMAFGSHCSPTLPSQESAELVAEAPALAAVTPERGPSEGGVELLLEGQDFRRGATVTVDGVPATAVAVEGPTRIRAVLPSNPGKWGFASVTVRNPDGQLAKRGDLFEYHASQLDFVKSAIPVNRGAFALSAGDFNGDNKADLVVGNDETSSLSIFLSNGTGGFGGALQASVGKRPRSIAVADLNGDGKQDLATANFESNDVSRAFRRSRRAPGLCR
jgi:hypothetical protein